MKFFISDTTKTNSKIGKWYYWHDDKCKIIKEKNFIILYHGYLIDNNFENEMLTNWEQLSNQNGNFFCCKITNDNIEVVVDYFDTSKIFYTSTNKIEITNSIKLMSITKNQIDWGEVGRRKNIPDTYNRSRDFVGGNWQNYHTFSSRDSRFKERSATSNKTIFKNIYQLQSQHKLLVADTITQIRTNDIHRDIENAFKSKFRFSNTKDLENCIFENMQNHALTIQENFENVACTWSEGVDSSFQSLFFPNSTQYSYHTVNPETVKLNYKDNIRKRYAKLNLKNINIYEFDVQKAPEYVKKYATDPTAFYYDFLPLYPTIKTAKQKPDILLVGSNADEMFMHRPDYLQSEVYEMYWHRDPKTALENTKQWFIDNQKCYSTRKNIDDTVMYWDEKIKDNDDDDDYWHGCPNHFEESLSYKVACGLYSRQISQELDIPVTSLYQDKRICFEVMRLPLEQRIEITKDCTLQRNIMQERFGLIFDTPFKDNASFNTFSTARTWYNATIPYALQDHLQECVKF